MEMRNGTSFLRNNVTPVPLGESWRPPSQPASAEAGPPLSSAWAGELALSLPRAASPAGCLRAHFTSGLSLGLAGRGHQDIPPGQPWATKSSLWGCPAPKHIPFTHLL